MESFGLSSQDTLLLSLAFMWIMSLPHITVVWNWTPTEGSSVDGICVPNLSPDIPLKTFLGSKFLLLYFITPILTQDPLGLTHDAHCPAKQYQIGSIFLSALDLPNGSSAPI